MPKLGFHEDLLKRLKEPKEAQGYLEAALADGDPALFLEALKDVAEAQGSMTSFAKKTKLHRTGLYRSFSPQGNPTYRSLLTVLEALGYRFRLERRTVADRFEAARGKAQVRWKADELKALLRGKA